MNYSRLWVVLAGLSGLLVPGMLWAQPAYAGRAGGYFFSPTTQPEPPVKGNAATTRPAVWGLKIACANWPDPSSLKQFGDDAIRLEAARTAEQKALAIWRWIRRVTMATTGRAPFEPGRDNIYDPTLVLNVYGAHHCDGLSRLMASSWQAQGYPAQKLYRSGHTMADCYWVDADGVGRYHMLDLNYGYFLYSRDGGHIASADEIGLDFSLQAFPSRTSRPWIEKQWWMWAWAWVGWPAETPYEATISLRPGERAERLWGDVGRPYCDNMRRVGADVDSAGHPMSYGNGIFAWSRDFSAAESRWRDDLILPPINAEVRDGQLGQADAAQPAELVYRGRFPYVVADVDLAATVGRGGRLAIDTSIDRGLTWRPAWNLPCRPGERLDLTLSKVQAKFSGPVEEPGSARPSLTTPQGRYDYLLRLRLSEGLTLSSLSCRTVVQLNYHVLANLIPGDNHITVTGHLAEGSAVEIAYVFDDADATGKRCVVRAESLPFRFTIQAAGKRWKDVRCRSVTAEAVRASGRGNRVISAPPPARTLPDGPMPALDIRVLNSITPDMATELPNGGRFVPATEQEVWARNGPPFPPAFKSAAEYIGELASEDEDVRRYAAAGLTVLRDPTAWQALEKLAIGDVTRAKYYAIQALYWTDEQRAWPVLEKILRADPEVCFAPPGGGVKEAPTRPNVRAMVSAMAGRSRRVQAIPLIARALADGGGPEPRWAMLRALGRIGEPAGIAAVRPFLGAFADTQAVAIQALAAMGDHGSTAAVAEFLKTPAMNVRAEAALEMMIRFRPPGYTDLIVPLLRNFRGERRALAADALAVCGDPAVAIPALQAALEKENFDWARRHMAAALEQLQDPRARSPSAP